MIANNISKMYKVLSILNNKKSNNTTTKNR